MISSPSSSILFTASEANFPLTIFATFPSALASSFRFSLSRSFGFNVSRNPHRRFLWSFLAFLYAVFAFLLSASISSLVIPAVLISILALAFALLHNLELTCLRFLCGFGLLSLRFLWASVSGRGNFLLMAMSQKAISARGWAISGEKSTAPILSFLHFLSAFNMHLVRR